MIIKSLRLILLQFVGVHAIFGKDPHLLSHPKMGVAGVHAGMGHHDSLLGRSGRALCATTDNHLESPTRVSERQP